MQKALPRFEKQGLAVAAMTYDSAPVLEDFARQFHVTYPLLSDPRSENIRAFGLVDPDNGPDNRPDYAKEDMAYPGYFWIGTDGIVKERFIGDKYYERFTANHVLARMFPELVETGSPVDARHLVIRTAQSDQDVIVGSRMLLTVDLVIPAGVHVYAPTVVGYRGLDLAIEGTAVRVRNVAYAKPDHQVMLPETKVQLPAFTQGTRISADVMVAPPAEVQKQLKGRPPSEHVSVRIDGQLRYQSCTDKVCYPPAEVPVRWSVRVHPRDDSRAPENVRDKPAPAAALLPYRNSWKLSFEKDGKSKVAGTVTDELAPVEIDGRKLMKRVQLVKYDSVAFESRNENVFDPATMAPVSMDFWKNGPLVNHREFDGRFVYFHTPGTPMKIVEYPQPVVDFYGGMYGLLIAALPLADGFSTTLHAVDEDDATYRDVPIRVLRREKVAAGPMGSVDAWLTQADTSMGAMRFWVTTTPPYIIRVEWDAKPGVVAVYAM